MDTGQRGAALEGQRSDVGHTFRNDDRFQRDAVAEGACADGGDTLGQLDALQCSAAGEACGGNVGGRAFKHDGLQRGGVSKCVSSQPGTGFGNSHSGQLSACKGILADGDDGLVNDQLAGQLGGNGGQHAILNGDAAVLGQLRPNGNLCAVLVQTGRMPVAQQATAVFLNVSRAGNDLAGEDLAAHGAGSVAGIALDGAGRAHDVGESAQHMAGCGNDFALLQLSGTIQTEDIAGVAVLGAGGIGGQSGLAGHVLKHGHNLTRSQQLIAGGAMYVAGVALCGAGGFNHIHGLGGRMLEHGHYGAGLNHFITGHTHAISAVALLYAARLNDALKRRLAVLAAAACQHQQNQSQHDNDLSEFTHLIFLLKTVGSISSDSLRTCGGILPATSGIHTLIGILHIRHPPADFLQHFYIFLKFFSLFCASPGSRAHFTFSRLRVTIFHAKIVTIEQKEDCPCILPTARNNGRR